MNHPDILFQGKVLCSVLALIAFSLPSQLHSLYDMDRHDMVQRCIITC